MQITLWGDELIGWTAAAAFAQAGNSVTFIPTEAASKDLETITPELVKSEPRLMALVREQQQNGRLKFGHNSADSRAANIHCFAFLPNQLQQAETILCQLKEQHSEQLLLINFSNFGIGATEKLQQQLGQNKDQIIAYIPDQLTAGAALKHFTQPNHWIIGSEDAWATGRIRALLRPFSSQVVNWQIMSSKEAEYTKYAITGMLALRLAYINDLANLADHLNVDIEVIRDAMGMDERIGQHYLSPGCGFGGQHFQQHIQGLAGTLQNERNSSLLSTALSQNEKQKELPFRKLWRHYDCQLQGKVISIWGLAFKPGTTSIAHAPSIKVIEALLAQGCIVKAHDPMAAANIEKHFQSHPQQQQLHICSDLNDTLDNSAGLILLTEWPEYWSPNYKQMLTSMAQPLIIDGRNIFDKELLNQLGFTYYGVGR